MQRNQIYKLVLTALFIAAGLVLSTFSQMIYFSGGAGMRIGFSSYISVLPAFLFGPVYGGVSMGIMDVLAFVIKPDGAYLFPLTLTAILGGVIRGYMWKYLKDKTLAFRPCILIFIIIFLFGAANFLLSGTATAYGRYIAGFGKKTAFLTILPMAFSLTSALLLLINRAAGETKLYSEKYINVLAVLMTSNIIVTTLNTILLMELIPSLSELAFIYFYLPRLAEEIANTSIQSYVVSYLVKLSGQLHKLN
ncbi:MAG: hypothetical protein J6N52_13350 [Clostridia bacterium]|nr:hypothetical protein [Clostridia bacterium]